MTEAASQKKRMGRPPKAPEKGKRQNYTFRMSDADRDRIIAAADASGRSMSEEIERRIEESFRASAETDTRTKSLIDNISQIISMFERATGKRWWEDEITASLCGDSLKLLIKNLMPKAELPANKLLELVESDKSRAEREAKQALWRTTLEMNAMDRAIRILRGEPVMGDDAKAVDKLSQPEKTSGTR